MFANTKLLPKILADLEECPVPLYLTGSRFFGGYRPDSDYDFFCAYTQRNIDQILALGRWEQERLTGDAIAYNDHNTSEVLVHYGEVQVHIQFVRDLALKVEVQNRLKDFPFQHLDKQARKHVWNWMYKQVQAGVYTR